MKHKFLLSLGLFCLLHLIAGRVQAMNLDTYDLDSLCYMSAEIVEADLVLDTSSLGKTQYWDARVTAVYKGNFKPDQLIKLAAIDLFSKPVELASPGYYEKAYHKKQPKNIWIM